MAARRVSTRLTGVAVSMLLLAGLGCSLCPFVPQPATDTPLPPPLPTEPPVPIAWLPGAMVRSTRDTMSWF
jgi:hypothetical protein